MVNNRGISLAEVIVVSAVIGVIGLVIPRLMQQSNAFFLMNRARMEIQQDARLIVSHVTRNVRQAVSSTIVISQEPGQPPYSMISFRKRSKSLDPAAPPEGDRVVYALRPGGQFVSSINGVERVLSQRVQFAAFAFPRSDDLRVVSFSLTVEKPVGGGKRKAVRVMSEKIGVMNE